MVARSMRFHYRQTATDPGCLNEHGAALQDKADQLADEAARLNQIAAYLEEEGCQSGADILKKRAKVLMDESLDIEEELAEDYYR